MDLALCTKTALSTIKELNNENEGWSIVYFDLTSIDMQRLLSFTGGQDCSK